MGKPPGRQAHDISAPKPSQSAAPGTAGRLKVPHGGFRGRLAPRLFTAVTDVRSPVGEASLLSEPTAVIS